MLGITSCAKKINSCPQFPEPRPETIDSLLDYVQGNPDVLFWTEANADKIELPIYETLIRTYLAHPEDELWLSKLLKLKQKLDERNK